MNDSQDVPRRSSRKKGKRNKQRDDIPLTGRKVSRDGHGKQKREGKEETLAKVSLFATLDYRIVLICVNSFTLQIVVTNSWPCKEVNDL